MNLNKIDALTGLPTYSVLMEHLAKRIQSKESLATGILYLEIDDPARFNDIFGYNTDKQILLHFAQNISNLLDDELFVRIGTYGFVIVKDHAEESDAMMLLAEKIINLLREPISFNENLLYLTAAIGIAVSSKENQDARLLVRKAEQAMKEAKKQGINRIVINSSSVLDFSCEQELKLLRDLPHAIENGEIYFVYQVQYSYSKSAFVGAEMLARWRHEELGHIPPSVFIPLAEKSGMITPLMTKTLIDAASMFRELDRLDLPDFSLSVNLPFQVLMEESFLDSVSFIVDAYGLKADTLTFEIMEDTIPDHIESFVARLELVKSFGFSLAVDDYGTGHTSLQYLLHFPVDYLKIDRSFVQDIHKNHRTFLLFESMIDMAKALDLKVVAEGVEVHEEDEILRKFGDLSVQGYLYSRPLEMKSLISKLGEQNR